MAAYTLDIPGMSCRSEVHSGATEPARPSLASELGHEATESQMAMGYWVVFADVSDPEGYKEYIAANGKALGKYGVDFWPAAEKRNRRKGSRGRA